MKEPFCKKCDGQMDWVDCWSGCDDGYFDGYEEDPLWYAPGEMEVCGNCGGKGGWWQCFNSRCQREVAEAVVESANSPPESR